jgi:hypothetical protein
MCVSPSRWLKNQQGIVYRFRGVCQLKISVFPKENPRAWLPFKYTGFDEEKNESLTIVECLKGEG